MLYQIAGELLFAPSPDEKLQAVSALNALCSGITKIGVGIASTADTQETSLDSGQAIGPTSAAQCMLDFARTTKFLRGIYAAIKAAQGRFPGQPLQILYAGCGPHAPLALPLATQFDASEVRFTLLDIHRRSLDAVRQLVHTLGLSDYVHDYVLGDATLYEHPRNLPLHMIITETMQRALIKEPQVAITLNLLPQMAAGGILIPQQIELSACLANPENEFKVLTTLPEDSDVCAAPDWGRIALGTIMKLSAETAHAWSRSDSYLLHGADASLPLKTLHIPPFDGGKEMSLSILTEVCVFGAQVLNNYESGISHPYILFELGHIESGAEVEFRYQLGNNPGLRYNLV